MSLRRAALGAVLAGCIGGCSGLPPLEFPRVHEELQGTWRQRLNDEGRRAVDLIRMALAHRDWRATDIDQLDLPPAERKQLRELIGLMRADPKAVRRMRRVADNPGMRVRFEMREMAIGRSELPTVEVPYMVTSVNDSQMELMIGSDRDREPTMLRFVDSDTFEAPWGSDGRTLVFDRVR